MIKTLIFQRHGNLRTEKDIRLRIDLLEGQSSSIAKMLTKVIKEHNEAAFAEYAERLASNRSRIEELLWVLGEKPNQSILDLPVSDKNNNNLLIRDIIEKLKAHELHMEDLPPDAQAMVRKGALEMRNSDKN
jgi:hypothetical protein